MKAISKIRNEIVPRRMYSTIIVMTLFFLLISAVSGTFIPADKAGNVAKYYADLAWGNALVGDYKLYYDLDGSPSAYMFEVIINGNKSATMVIGANDNHTPFIERYEGLPFHISQLNTSRKLAESKLGQNLNEPKFLYSGPFNYWVNFSNSSHYVIVSLLSKEIINYAKNEVGSVVAITNVNNANKKLMFARTPEHKERILNEWKEVENGLSTIDSVSTSSTTVSATRISNYISGVPDYPWDIGCVPTSAAIVFGYWDNHNYGDLVTGSTYDIVDELATAMGTDRITGGTNFLPPGHLAEEIIKVANKKNERYNFDASDTDNKAISNFKDEIDAGRPILFWVFYDNSSPIYNNHVMAGIGYNGNTVIVHDTWGPLGDVYINYNEWADYGYTKIIPDICPENLNLNGNSFTLKKGGCWKFNSITIENGGTLIIGDEVNLTVNNLIVNNSYINGSGTDKRVTINASNVIIINSIFNLYDSNIYYAYSNEHKGNTILLLYSANAVTIINSTFNLWGRKVSSDLGYIYGGDVNLVINSANTSIENSNVNVIGGDSSCGNYCCGGKGLLKINSSKITIKNSKLSICGSGSSSSSSGTHEFLLFGDISPLINNTYGCAGPVNGSNGEMLLTYIPSITVDGNTDNKIYAIKPNAKFIFGNITVKNKGTMVFEYNTSANVIGSFIVNNSFVNGSDQNNNKYFMINASNVVIINSTFNLYGDNVSSGYSNAPGGHSTLAINSLNTSIENSTVNVIGGSSSCYSYCYGGSALLKINSSKTAIKNSRLSICGGGTVGPDSISGTHLVLIYDQDLQFKDNSYLCAQPNTPVITQQISPENVTIGSNLTFTITAHNYGESLSDVNITDVLPYGINYTIGTSIMGGTPKEPNTTYITDANNKIVQKLEWRIGNISNGSEIVLKFNASINVPNKNALNIVNLTSKPNGRNITIISTLPIQDTCACNSCDFNVRNVTYELHLHQGWNLISVPVVPYETSLSSMLKDIEHKYTGLYTYTDSGYWEFKVFINNSWVGNMDKIEMGKGYWINMEEPATLTIIGYTIPFENASIPLKKGRNLVGWPSIGSQDIGSQDMPTLNIRGNFTDIYTFDRAWKFIAYGYKTWFGNLDKMEPGRGYWINVKYPSVLTPCISNNANVSIQSITSQEGDGGVCMIPTIIYGSLYEDVGNGKYEKFPWDIDIFAYQLDGVNEPILIGKGKIQGGDYYAGVAPSGSVKIAPKGFDSYTPVSISCGQQMSKDIVVYSPWFNCSWKYRKPIQIKNDFGENLNNYQVSLNIDTFSLISQGKMKNDCSDTRFVYRGKELPYYLESGCNTSNTNIWIKVNLSNYEAKILYMHHGNQNATGKSNGSKVFEFFDDVEHDNIGWTTSGTHNLWAIEGDDYSSSSHLWQEDNYNVGHVVDYLISPSFNLADTVNPELIFKEKYSTEYGWDMCYVDISTDNGNSWVNIRSGVSGNSGGWVQRKINISNYKSSTIRIRFRFDTIDDWYNSYPGWFIDDIRIQQYVSLFPSLSIGGEQLNDWWNCSWNHRKKISIVEKSGKEIKDYQTALNINTQSLISTGQLKQDCSDIRFIDNNKELPYYVEYGCNTSNTKIWIKINMSASQTKEIYIYYGNSNGLSKSDANSVFDFFDDIETINTTKWNLWGYPQPYIYSSSIARINGDGYYHSGMTSKQIFNLSNIIFEVKEKNWPVSYNGRPRGWGISSKNTYGSYESSTTFVGFYEWCDYKNNCRRFYAPGYINNFGTANDQYHISSISAINRTILKFFFDGSNVGNYGGNISYDNGYFELWAHDPDSYADWARIRKYVSQEPDVYVDNIQMMQTMYISQEQQENNSIMVNVSIDDITITKKEESKGENISNLTELQPNTSLIKTKLRGKIKEKVNINESIVLGNMENTSKLNELYVNKIFNESNESIRVIVKFKKNTTNQTEKIKDRVINKIVDKNEMYQLMENEDVDSIEEDVKVNALMNDSYSAINYTVAFNNTEFNGSGIKVAVIDTGILHNSSLFPNICCEYDFVEKDTYAQDENGHGTHVASIMTSNLEPRGIAPGITLVPIRALDASGGGYTSDIIKAVYYAIEQNVSIISLSLGAINSPILTETANEIVKDYNVTIVVAAGNYGPNSGTITSPGDAEYTITVGAIDKNNEIAYFSSRGPVNGISKPDVVAPGVNIVTYSTNGLKGMSGTSASTPFVSGLAALLLQQNNHRTPTEIKEIIMNNAVNLSCEINVCGYGKINVGKALFENYKANKSNESNINETLNNTENKTDKLNYSNYEIKTINVTAGDTILITYKITNPLNKTKFDVTIYGINESWAKYERKITLKKNETKTEKAFIRIPTNSNNEVLNITIVTYNEVGTVYTNPIMVNIKAQEEKDKRIKDRIKNVTEKFK
ncbi:MAG: hypothetical protein BWK75_00410 [Candidatus Altiarchaeales archaeon A3]|nr:MAG: hypothetical protein BWK75_00410 [Candidatus Altiarchaeales archaeon A3]